MLGLRVGIMVKVGVVGIVSVRAGVRLTVLVSYEVGFGVVVGAGLECWFTAQDGDNCVE